MQYACAVLSSVVCPAVQYFSTSSSSGAEPPLIGGFGLLKDILPLALSWTQANQLFDLHLTKVLYDVVLPSIIGSSSWSRG